jgi:rfaE bifunctional protein kinase chain/domain
MTARLLSSPADSRVRQIIESFGHSDVLVIGDVMLDRFLIGRVTRISPEAPVPVVAFDHETQRVGGAANVAHNVRTLGGRVELLGVIGNDEAGQAIVNVCDEARIKHSLWTDSDRPTTTKVRIVTERNQQVARVDYEVDSEIRGSIETKVVEELARPRQPGAILVSDYLKGCITRNVMAAAIEAGRRFGIPVLVDPKIPHLDYYAGATLVTPNHHEAEIATHLRIRTHGEARDAAREFRRRTKCESVLMTRGDQGMWLLDRDAEGYLPAAAREVADVTGAGDTVIATLALSLASGATLTEAAWLANHSAAIVVGKFGPATLTPEELLSTLPVRNSETTRE